MQQSELEFKHFVQNMICFGIQTFRTKHDMFWMGCWEITDIKKIKNTITTQEYNVSR
jgi:hypothetical protein